VKKQRGSAANGEADEEDDESQDGGFNFDDMVPRVDIRLVSFQFKFKLFELLVKI